jgi:energy-coupling factor transporter ATP-binding protein EcfA2
VACPPGSTVGAGHAIEEVAMTDEMLNVEGSHVGGSVELTGDSRFAGRDQYNFTFQVAPFRPPPDLAALRAAYADYLLSAHRYLDFKGVPQIEKVATLLPLEEVFVPLHARPAAPEADTWRRLRLAGREMDEVEETLHLEGLLAPAEGAGPLPIDAALNKEAALAILGDPGAGKSTLLKHLALHLARAPEGPLPILLPLNAYAEALQREEVGLQAYLARYYAARRKELEGIATLFDAALAAGQAVVLLDGLDEVQERRLFVNGLVEDFVAAHRQREGNRFVVTSRIVGYRDAPLSAAAWPVYTLADWGREEIERFAARWALAFEVATHGDTPEARAAAEDERQDLLAAIIPGSGIERLASNPAMKNTRAGGRSSGYEGQTLEGSIRRQGVRDCSSLGASWSKGRGGSKIELSGASTGTQSRRCYGGWRRIWTRVLNICWI